MSIEYFYIGAQPNPSNVVGSFKKLVRESDKFNPIWNFSADFFTQLQSITAVDLAMSVPFISLSGIDLSGKAIENFNVKYFHAPINLAEIGAFRNSDRPIMSIKSLEVKTDNASGNIYYERVTVSIKIHRPDVFASSALIALLFPGMPLKLEYGRQTSNPNSILNQKKSMMFAVVDYTINIDLTGQAELVINGMAFNDRFNNARLADDGTPVNTDKVSDKEFNGLNAHREKIAALTEEITKQQNKSGNVNNKIIKSLTEQVISAETKARQVLKNRFTTLLKQIRANNRVRPFVFGQRGKPRETVSFHDIVHYLAGGTLNAMKGSLFPAEKYRLIYGSFNESFGAYANTSIAEFPIDWKVFMDLIGKETEAGEPVVTVEKLFNLLVDNFIKNETYWKTRTNAQEKTNPPDIVIKLSPRFENQQTIVDVYILDINTGLPITTNELPDSPISQKDRELTISSAGASPLPILSLGHANSFIKNISFSHISDQNVKAVFIKRMDENRRTTLREAVPMDASLDTVPNTPLTLPLQGEAEFLGTSEWRPHRAFYLSSGISLIDAVYKITSVTDIVTQEGFTTKVSFIYH